jgi:NADH-quinone oxidoreductase subunit N
MYSFFLNPLLTFIHGDGLTILPQMELLLFALGILIFDFLLDPKEKHWNAALALFGIFASAVGVAMQANRYTIFRADPTGPQGLLGFHDSVLVDGFSILFALLFLAATGLVVLLSVRYLEIEPYQSGEYYVLLLLACSGMMFVSSGIDLIVMFLGIELLALCSYILSGFFTLEKRSNEAALKYFLLGSFSSGILAYGFSILYGLGRSTRIGEIANELSQREKLTHIVALSHQQTEIGEQARQLLQTQFPAALHFDPYLIQVLPVLAFILIVAGLFFKIAAVPFHQWAPDVYEGAPTPITAFISTASITAAFALLIRLSLGVFGDSQANWQYVIAGVAIASIAWGNIAALTQTNLKRLLAYSSISQVGYILLGLAAGNFTGLIAMAYSLIAYIFMTIGIFAVFLVLHQRGLIGDRIDDLDGLYERSPASAILLLLFILSLAGIPLTAGFMGKYFIFQSLIETHHPTLAIVAALFLLPGLYYYFRIISHAWLRKSGNLSSPSISTAQTIVLSVAAFVTLLAGLYPEPFMQLARYAFGQ